MSTLRLSLPALIAFIPLAAAAEGLVEIGGRSYWLNGVNMPWNAFGSDFGNHYQWGDLYDREVFDAAFEKYAVAGINAVRLWVHCDGRGNPEFASVDGMVTGLDPTFLDDFADMLALADRHGLFVMPALWSFDMVQENASAGQYAGKCRGLIDDTTKTRSYIDNALVPIVQRFDGNERLLAWEICNEPEWMVENHGVSRENVQRFHAMIAAAIHANCSTPVTTGAASVKWHSEQSACVGNWWSDEALRARYDDPGAYLDFYQVHFYEWMIPWGYNVFEHGIEHYGLTDRPVMIGECPGKDVDASGFAMTLSDMYEKAYELGYAGVFAWSDRASDGAGEWAGIAVAAREFADAHAGIVNGPGAAARLRRQHVLHPAAGRRPETGAYVGAPRPRGDGMPVWDVRGRRVRGPARAAPGVLLMNGY